MGKVYSFRGKAAAVMAPILREIEVAKMSEKWDHVICSDCYAERHPGRTAHRTAGGVDLGECCFCGEETDEGIFVRADPAITNCQAVTGIHVKE